MSELAWSVLSPGRWPDATNEAEETTTPVLTDATGVTVQEVLGIENKGESKRGPKSKLDRQFDSVRRLPRKEREFVSKFLDTMLSQTQR